MRVLGDERHDQMAQDHVSHEFYVVTSFVVVESDLGFEDAKGVFDGGPGEGGLQDGVYVGC